MATSSTRSPLLKIGTYGLHVLDNPAGTWSYVGTIPTYLKGLRFPTEQEATEWAYRAIFNDFLNDYLTIEKFAADYGIEEDHASEVLSIGRKLHQDAWTGLGPIDPDEPVPTKCIGCGEELYRYEPVCGNERCPLFTL